MEADLIVHVVDASVEEEELAEMLAAVDDVLDEVGAGDRPRLLALNKVDELSPERRRELGYRHPRAVQVSALTGEGLDDLRDAIEAHFLGSLRPMELLVPYAEGGSLSELHEVAGELEREETPAGVRVRARVPVGAGPALRALRRERNGRGHRLTLAFARLDPAARPPARAHDDDAGYDLHAAEPASLEPGGRASIGTGIAVAVPPRVRRAGPAALGPRGAARHRARQRTRPDRPRLPRRGAGAAPQHGPASGPSRSRSGTASRSSCWCASSPRSCKSSSPLEPSVPRRGRLRLDRALTRRGPRLLS